jgi:hypothetical protein
MFIEIIALGLISGIFWNRRSNALPKQITEPEVESVFSSKHELWPEGARDLMIDGASFPHIFAQGNPEPRNPMNQLFTYPQSKASSEINKNNEYWQSIGVLDKEKQLDFIQEKIAMDDTELLTARYKQLDGRTKSAQPKINLKNFWATKNTFGNDISREGALRRGSHYA